MSRSVAARTQSSAQETAPAKVAVIDLDRMAAQSEPGKKLLQQLKEETDRLVAEQRRREQEIVEVRRRLNITAEGARAALAREIDRKEVDLKRWLEDKQREFQEGRQAGEDDLQRQFGLVVEQYAKERESAPSFEPRRDSRSCSTRRSISRRT